MRSTRVLLPLVLCLLAAGCLTNTRAPAPVVPAPPAAPAPGPTDAAGTTLYKLNPAASQVDILVYRGGTLARFGHNHVMTSKAVNGSVWLHPQAEKSSFSLSFAVADLIVDDAAARRAAGSDFPPDIPQGDKDGTRRNMLRAEVLDGEHFPEVKLRSVRVTGTDRAATITTLITLKDASREVEVPATITRSNDRVTATGEFDVLQSDFGMKPFSVALGAIAVKDQLHIKFSLVAEKADQK